MGVHLLALALPQASETYRGPQLRPEVREFWGRVPLPDALRTYGRLVLDRAGNLWVQGYTVLDQEECRYVLDPHGRWLGDVTPLTGLRISEISED